MAKKRKSKKRARPRTSRRTVSKTKNRTMERWFLVIVSVIIIGAIILSIPSVNLNGIMHQEDQEQQEQQQSEITSTYPCKGNLDCFLINCRDTPSDVECVNAVASDTYGSDVCGSYSKVSVPYHDYTICTCVQGLCKLIR